MAKKNYIAGLDIGSSKICAAVGNVNINGQVEVAGIGTAPARGFSLGAVSDLSLASESIDKAISVAESQSGAGTYRVFVAVINPDIGIINALGSSTIADKENEINQRDIHRAMASARDTAIPLERQVIHTVNLGYSLNGQRGIKDPLGLYGTRLNVNLNLITSPYALLQNLSKAVSAAGLEIEGVCPASVATGMSVLKEEETQDGVVLADVGMGLTEVSIYQNGALRELHTMTTGMAAITQHIAAHFRIPEDTAESIARTYLCFPCESVSATEKISVRTNYEETAILRRELCDVAGWKLKEIFSTIKDKIDSYNFGKAPYSIVLTGGLSLVDGAAEAAGEYFGSSVRLGYSRNVMGSLKNITNPTYSSAIGLLRYAVIRRSIIERPSGNFVSRTVSRIKELYREYF
ncbi:MAG: cell division protein FtsA [Candidatus Omnitrophota bacterium]